MDIVVEILKVFAGLPDEKFTSMVSLSGIALAAYAIYIIQKGRGQ
ncbi:hypothetical protein [Agrobacterium cavarae]